MKSDLEMITRCICTRRNPEGRWPRTQLWGTPSFREWNEDETPRGVQFTGQTSTFLCAVHHAGILRRNQRVPGAQARYNLSLCFTNYGCVNHLHPGRLVVNTYSSPPGPGNQNCREGCQEYEFLTSGSPSAS